MNIKKRKFIELIFINFENITKLFILNDFVFRQTNLNSII